MRKSVYYFFALTIGFLQISGCTLNKTYSDWASTYPDIEKRPKSSLKISESETYGMWFQKGSLSLKSLPQNTYLHLMSYAGGSEGSMRLMHWIEREKVNSPTIEEIIQSTDYNLETIYPKDNFDMGKWIGVTKAEGKNEILSDTNGEVNGIKVRYILSKSWYKVEKNSSFRDRRWTGKLASRQYLHAIIETPKMTLDFFQVAGGNIQVYNISEERQTIVDTSSKVKEQINAFIQKHIELLK